MTDRQDYTRLIAEARETVEAETSRHPESIEWDRLGGYTEQLLDALEVVTAERDALRAEKETGGNAS